MVGFGPPTIEQGSNSPVARMHPDFWHQRWQERRIGFHQDAPTPLLLAHWDALDIAADAGVFVPLAGKSHDMAWLAARGHRVLGSELSPLAVRDFFDEHEWEPTRRESLMGTHWQAHGVELIEGDVFDLDDESLAGCSAVFDRAALIALPPALRARYVHEVYSRLPTRCRGLLITLEYPQPEKAGPPFSVEEAEVRALFEPRWQVEVLERRDILGEQPGFVAEGVTRLATVAYRLHAH